MDWKRFFRKKKNVPMPMGNPVYSYWRALYLSFFSRQLYIDVVYRWHGCGVRYLFFIVLIGSLPWSITIYRDFSKLFYLQTVEPVQDLPPLMVQNGEVSFDRPMPYFVKNKHGEVVSIVDTTGKVVQITQDYPQLKLLVTNDRMYFRIPRPKLFGVDETRSEVYVHPFPQDANAVFVGKEWLDSSGIWTLKFATDVFIFCAVNVLSYGLCLVILLFFTLLGHMASHAIFRYKINYRDAYRLSTVASTPVIFIMFGVLALKIIIPELLYICFAINAMYYCYGILAARSMKTVVRE